MLIIISSGLPVKIKWFRQSIKVPKQLIVSFSRTTAGFCIYHLFVWSNFNFFHVSQWITLSRHSCLVLYSFSANLLHSLIMWLIVSSLSPRSLHWLFCCVLSILALIWLVLMVFFCAAIRRDYVSLLRFHFLIHVQALPWLGSFIPSVRCHLLHFIASIAHFPIPNSISISWLNILTACIRLYSYFFLFFFKYFDVIQVH